MFYSFIKKNIILKDEILSHLFIRIPNEISPQLAGKCRHAKVIRPLE